MNNKAIFELTGEDFISSSWYAVVKGFTVYFNVTDRLNAVLTCDIFNYEGMFEIEHVEHSEKGDNYLAIKIGATEFQIKQIDAEGFFLTIPKIENEVHFSKR